MHWGYTYSKSNSSHWPPRWSFISNTRQQCSLTRRNQLPENPPLTKTLHRSSSIVYIYISRLRRFPLADDDDEKKIPRPDDLTHERSSSSPCAPRGASQIPRTKAPADVGRLLRYSRGRTYTRASTSYAIAPLEMLHHAYTHTEKLKRCAHTSARGKSSLSLPRIYTTRGGVER